MRVKHRLAELLSKERPELVRAVEIRDNHDLQHLVGFAQPPLLEAIGDLLKQIPIIAELQNKTIVEISSSGPVQLSYLAQALVERVASGVDPEAAIEDLVDLASNKPVHLTVLAGLGGVVIDQSFELAQDIQIRRVSDIAPSIARETIFGVNRNGRSIFNFGRFQTIPGVGLTVKFKRPLFYDDKDHFGKERSLVDEFTEIALAAITLAGDGAPSITITSHVIEHPAVSYSGLSGHGYYWRIEPPPQGPIAFDIQSARELFAALKDFSMADRPGILLSIDRLRRSRLHRSAVERAIELGIALESALLHDVGADHRELRFRLSLRGAWLVGIDGTDRRTIFIAIRDAYDLRSRAAHTGKLDDPKAASKLMAGDAACRRLLRRIVSDGKFPTKWQDIILGDFYPDVT